jgi:hypothetical protein
MQRDATIAPTGLVRHESPLLKRFCAKLVVEVLPAAFVSVLGGFVLAQYQFSHLAASRPTTVQVVPASAEMMELVRDEHAVIIDYLKAQLAAEKTRHDAEDAAGADARRVAEVEATATAAAPVALPQPRPATAVAAKPVAPRAKLAAAPSLPPHAPLVVAQADQTVPAAPAADAPHEPKSLLTRTIEIKDHVVGATLHVVSAIGGIPSWIASMGDRIGGGDPAPAPVAPAPRQFTTS